MNSKGFTLIELVVVIVILGILSVTVAPKFFDFKADAQTSVLEGLRASIDGATERVHSKSIVMGSQNEPESQIELPKGVIDIAFGYPLDTNASTQYWTILGVLDANNNENIVIRQVSEGGDNRIIFYSPKLGDVSSSNADCVVVYNAPSIDQPRPEIRLNKCI